MKVSKLIGALALSVLTLGCGDDDGTDPDPTLKIALASGNSQTQVVGRALTNNLTAKVTNAADQPVSGITVNWTVTAGGGSLSAATSVTDAEGLASTSLTVGPTETTNTVTATIASQPTASVSFTAAGQWETFGSDMTGAKEVPALTNTAVGTATYKLLSSSSMSYQVVASGLTGTWTGLHIHATCCNAAGGAGVIVNLCPAAANCAISGTGTFSQTGTFTAADISSASWATALTQQQKFDSLLVLMRKGDGSAYTNIHTSVNTGGQARGEIVVRAPAGAFRQE
jgi:hypothetical protein